MSLFDNPEIEAKAREMDPEFWADWDATPEHRRMNFHYEAKVLKLDEAREALGLPE